MPTKKVLIMHATAGSGHTKAAQAIYKAFEELDHDLGVKIVNSLDYTTPSFKWTYPNFYVFLVNRAPLLWGFSYYILDSRFFYPLVSWIRHLVNWINTRKMVAFLREDRPDLIIHTHFLAPDVVAMMGKNNATTHTITVVTDYRLHSFWLARGTDIYVAGYKETVEDLAKRGVPRDKIKLLGIPISPIFSKSVNRAEVHKNLNIKEDIFTVLVGSGGFGIGPVEELVKELMGIEIPMQLLVVCGKNELLHSAIKKLADTASFPIIPLGFVNNMHELMEISDLTITKSGGLVCAEALAKDLPMIGIFPIPGQEERNLDLLLKKGVGRRLKRISDIKSLVMELYRSEDSLSKMKEGIAKVKRPHAALDIAKLAIDTLRENG